MEIRCPECDASLSADDMNVRKDVAVCPECDEAFKISELLAVEKKVAGEFDLGQPPLGVSFEKTTLGWRLTAMARTYASLSLTAFSLIWSGMTLFFVVAYIESGD